ncbi:MAG: ribosomal L7Ae/L30e/S12e/Gadd45 family protein [Oscillospiraceae bacterium]|nr:ribosomal L7Ae/L30e/S12e/Gadd45 family protein [Oscillospiraceae bacterium]
MENNRSLGLLSISRKGGNIVYGEETVGAQARASRARLIILSSDAGGHTVRRAKSFAAGTSQPIITVPFTKEELGDALGTTSCAIAAITDVRLAQAFVKSLGEPEKNQKLLEDLDVRVKRVEQRRAEEKAHRYNVRHGKK